jgi:hypothetical protein
MLAQLTSIKSRLGILPEDTTNDALLTSAIQAVSARFDAETCRTLSRTVDFRQEFDADTTEIIAACFPIESVAEFEFKTSETSGWQQLTPSPDFLIRSSGIISLPSSFSLYPLSLSLCRVTYSGGYVLPGDIPAPGQIPLPADLESAAIEQIVFWFQTRDHVGVNHQWPKGGTYEQFADLDLLPSVRAILAKYRRLIL